MLPWPDMLRTAAAMGLGHIFWRLSLKEWRWLTGDGASAPSADNLARLMVQFPDSKGDKG